MSLQVLQDQSVCACVCASECACVCVFVCVCVYDEYGALAIYIHVTMQVCTFLHMYAL